MMVNMYWADKIAEEIIKSGEYKPYWVDDMFTPSGYPHVGSLRGPLVHDVVYKALKNKGAKVKWTYIMNDFDPIDGLPPDLMDKLFSYMGVPVRLAPSPVEGFASFGEYFSKDIQSVLKNLGVEAQYLSSWDMYKEGKFNDVIKEALDNADKIQDIYEEVSGSKKREKGWLPLQVICEKCGKLGTTRVHDWNGKTVKYTCEPEMVKWAKGCGYKGEISPFDGNGKLPWKVDWPAHWKVIGVTIEGAGKDHSSAGGSRDIAKALCKEVFRYPNPFNIPYEFILIGGKKMASSKGLGLKARDLSQILPLDIGRFLFIRTEFRKQVEFDPTDPMAIPVIFGEYQKAADAYFDKTNEELARVFELSQVSDKIIKPPSVRFSVLTQWVQMPNMEEEIIKNGLESWAKYARVWLEKFAPEKDKFEVQKELLNNISQELNKKWDAEEFQTKIYDLGKELGLGGKDTFAAIYLSLLGKDHGPKAAWLILSLDRDFVKERFSVL